MASYWMVLLIQAQSATHGPFGLLCARQIRFWLVALMAIAIRREFSKKGLTSSVFLADLRCGFLAYFFDALLDVFLDALLRDRLDVFFDAFLANCRAAGDFVMTGIPVVCD